MSKYTPGPWKWSDDYKSSNFEDTWSLLGADGFGILSCDGKTNSPQEVNTADALLIAAAPDLLEALLGLMIGAEAMGWNTANAKNAIAKATGEKNV